MILHDPAKNRPFLLALLDDAYSSKKAGRDADEEELQSIGRALAELGQSAIVDELLDWTEARDEDALSLVAEMIRPLWEASSRRPGEQSTRRAIALAGRATADQTRYDVGLVLVRIIEATRGTVRTDAEKALAGIMATPIGHAALDRLLKNAADNAKKPTRRSPL
ncbi:hypothetical protein L6R52_19085 [Myxococcota bacterium]|nr:hypothetical protein [Myxococcota bacterium]